MIKRLIVGFFAMLATAVLCSVCAGAETDVYYGDYRLLVNDGSVTLNAYTGSERDVVIPDEIEGYHITSISTDVFADNTTIRSVVIPEGVKYIQGRNYSNSNKGAFENCTALESVSLPSTLVSIGRNVFKNTKILNDCTETIKYIDDWVIECTNASEIKSVKLKDGTVGIAYGAFNSDNSKLKSVTLPDSLRAVSDYAFSGCPLESVTFPDNLTYIGKGAFDGCKLKSPVLPEALEYVGSFAFANTNVSEITFPSKLAEIQEGAFANCLSLKSITLPDSLKVIGDEAFSGCTSLKTVIGGDSAEEVGRDTFSGCPFITEQKTDIKYLGKRWIVDYDGTNPVITIPKVIKGIAGGTFDCGFKGDKYNITEVNLPEGLMFIGDEAFYNSDIKDLTLPGTLKKVGESAFDGCNKLEKVTIAPGMTKLPFAMFSGCKSLKSVVIPDGIKIIDDICFSDCDSLQKVTLPKSLEEVSFGAFGNCNKLADVYYEGSESDWRHIYEDYENDSLINAKIHCDTPLPESALRKSLGKITGMRTARTSSKIILQWNAVDGADGYKLERFSGGKWVQEADITAPEYTAKGLEKAAKYKFRIRAYAKKGDKLIYGKYRTISKATR